jgi:hypothetical protein
VHGKLFRHLYGLQCEWIRIDAEPLQTEHIPQMTEPPVGWKSGFFRCQYNFVEYNILEYECDKGQDDHGSNRPEKMPPHYFQMFQEGHFSFIVLTHSQSC